jgi:hypothetical protein
MFDALRQGCPRIGCGADMRSLDDENSEPLPQASGKDVAVPAPQVTVFALVVVVVVNREYPIAPTPGAPSTYMAT